MYSGLPSSSAASHITIIDDDEAMHFLFKILIKKYTPGLVVSAYTNAKVVLKMMHNNSFQTSAIVLDLNMPEMDGFQFLRELEKIGSSIPVYVASSSDSPSDISDASVFKNVVKYLVKPLTPEHIRMITQKQEPPVAS